MKGIEIYKYSNVSWEVRVFSHVSCLSLSGFDEISEAAFDAGRSPTDKAEQEGKRLQNVYIIVRLTPWSQNVWERERER